MDTKSDNKLIDKKVINVDSDVDDTLKMKDENITQIMPSDKFSATATEKQLKKAAKDKYRVWQENSVFNGLATYDKPIKVYESWDEMRKSDAFIGNRTYGCPIINSFWDGLDLDDDQSVKEWDPKIDREIMHIVFFSDDGNTYHYACKVIRDANHDAAIKAVLREKRKKWFSIKKN